MAGETARAKPWEMKRIPVPVVCRAWGSCTSVWQYQATVSVLGVRHIATGRKVSCGRIGTNGYTTYRRSVDGEMLRGLMEGEDSKAGARLSWVV
jgi:hypothetical protein